MGGENSEVRADTTAILLESANFDAVRIRQTAARLGLRTEASSRFEKSLDPVRPRQAARRFVQLLLEHVPEARVTRRLADAYPRPYPPLALELPFGLVARRLGSRVTHMEVRENLTALGFAVKEIGEGFRIDVPTWRATKDVECAEDLVEEVGRIHGYEDMPDDAAGRRADADAPVAAPAPGAAPVGAVLSLDLGYAEMKTYAFYGPRDAERVGLADAPHLHIREPPHGGPGPHVPDGRGGSAASALRENVVRDAGGPAVGVDAPDRAAPRGATEGLPDRGARTRRRRPGTPRRGDDPGRACSSAALVEDVRAVLAAAPVRARHGARRAATRALAAGLPAPVWLHPGRRAVFEAGWPRAGRRGGGRAPPSRAPTTCPGRAALAEIALEPCSRPRPEGRRVPPGTPLSRRAVRRLRARAASGRRPALVAANDRRRL